MSVFLDHVTTEEPVPENEGSSLAGRKAKLGKVHIDMQNLTPPIPPPAVHVIETAPLFAD